MAALIWLIGAVVLAAAELISGDFVLLMLGGAALAGAGAEWAFGSTALSVAVFAVVAIGLVTVARPALKRHFLSEHVADNAAALVGASAVVTSTVDGTGGRIKLRGGDWSARALDPARPIGVGAAVMVVQIDGATAIVVPDTD